MESRQKTIVSWVLFWTFWGIFVLFCAGTLSMLFLGGGNVLETERATLINILIGEVSVGLFALFYSVFNLKKDSSSSATDSDVVNRLKAQIDSQNNEISILRAKLEDEINKFNLLSETGKYRDAIKAICSTLSDTKLEDVFKGLGLDVDGNTHERQIVLSEIGLMKDEGILVNQNSLYPDAVRLVTKA